MTGQDGAATAGQADLGRVAYEAYKQASHGKSAVSGQPLPSWDDQDETIQMNWRMAAGAVWITIDQLQNAAAPAQPAPGSLSQARRLAEQQPAPGPAELQVLLDNERTRRLHMAGERDEARSDLRRMHRLALDILATFPDGSARARRWHEQADHIIGRHSEPAPGLGTAWRLLDETRQQLADRDAQLRASLAEGRVLHESLTEANEKLDACEADIASLTDQRNRCSDTADRLRATVRNLRDALERCQDAMNNSPAAAYTIVHQALASSAPEASE